MPYPLFWIGSANFGDALNPVLYKAVTGREPVYSDASPKIIAIGSLVQSAKPGDIIWGTGCMAEDLELHCDATTRIIATRGPLTDILLEKRGAKPSGIHGDPAILLPKFFPMSEEKKYKLGIIPHYADYETAEKMYMPEGSKLIRLFESPLEVIKQIVSCETIISSSLHGIVVAEAYGIPAVWVEFSDNVYGKGFKFRDYYGDENIRPVNLRNGGFSFCFDWRDLTKYDDRLLSVCPFDLDPRWEGELPVCTDRVKQIAQLIDIGLVLDIGAGKMELKEFLPEGCSYQPVDFIKRCNETIICNLNGDINLPPCDVAVFSGSLEYIKDIPKVIKALRTKIIITSYATLEMNSSLDNRRFNGWINDFREDEIISLFEFCGFDCVYREIWGTQMIFKFVPNLSEYR